MIRVRKIILSLLIATLLSACGGGGDAAAPGDTVVRTGPNVSLGPVEVSLTINSEGELVFDGSFTPTLIGIENLGGIGWEFGFETTLYEARKRSNLLLVLYENGDGEIMQNEYDIREPFDIRFSSTDWVRRMKRAENGSIVVYVERRPALQAHDAADQPDPARTPAPGFIRSYYGAINAGDYRSAWGMLTDAFRSRYNSSGYDPYADWWATVDYVDVLAVNVTEQDAQHARLYVELSYSYASGNVDTYDLMLFTLVYAASADDWMIDDAYLVSGTR